MEDRSEIGQRSTYQSGIRCGQPRGPVVAQVTVRSSARNEAASASLILICSRRLTLAILRGSIARRPPCGLLSIALARTRPRAIPGPRDRTDAAALVAFTGDPYHDGDDVFAPRCLDSRALEPRARGLCAARLARADRSPRRCAVLSILAP